MRRVNILLIEDDPVDAEAFCRDLHTGLALAPHVVVVRTLADGLERALEGDFDILVMDLHLPDQRDGGNIAWLTKRITSAPLVVLSGLSGEVHAANALRDGAQDYIPKERQSSTELALRLEYAIERHRAQARSFAARSRENEDRDRLFAHVSHELRTPLTAIVQFTSILRDGIAGDVSSKQAEYLDIIADNADQLHGMIRTLVDVSRAQNGKLGCELQLGYLTPVVRAACATMAPRVEAAQLTIDLECHDGLGRILLDRRRITEVVTNVIDNAIKYTPAGGTIGVRVSRAPEPDKLRVSITDTGPGVSEGRLEEIFDRLAQVGNANGTSRRGLGLGLFLCREIVEQHHGHIWAERNDSQGLTIHTELPLFDAESFCAGVLRGDREAVRGATVFRLDLIATGPARRAPGMQTATPLIEPLLRASIDARAHQAVQLGDQSHDHAAWVVLAADVTDPTNIAAQLHSAIDEHPQLGQRGFRVELHAESVALDAADGDAVRAAHTQLRVVLRQQLRAGR